MKTLALFALFFSINALCFEGIKVDVTPNNQTQQIAIHVGDHNHASMVQIISDNGDVIWTEHRKEKEFKLDLQYFPAGKYTIQISIYDQVEQYTFVKSK